MPNTPKGRALGNALRRAREDCGLTVRQVAARLERDPGVLSRWETGQRMPKPEQVAQLLTTLDVRGRRYEEIVSLAYDPDGSNWIATTLPGQRQQLATLLDMERNATKIIEVAPLLIPGLLQTDGYMRTMMMSDHLSFDEAETRMAVRVGRREVIDGFKPARLVALIGQTALYHMIGGVATMVEQSRYLIEMAHRPNIDLRIIPCNAGWHPALEGEFTMIESDVHDPVVVMENRRSGLFLHQQDDVRVYQRAVDDVLKLVMSHQDSVRFLSGLVDKMEAGK